jgi:hypothetical protein
VRVLDCVTHALNCIKQPDPARIRPDDIGRDLSPVLLQEVLSFLGSIKPALPPSPLDSSAGAARSPS